MIGYLHNHTQEQQRFTEEFSLKRHNILQYYNTILPAMERSKSAENTNTFYWDILYGDMDLHTM